MEVNESEILKIIKEANTQIDFDKLSPEINLRDIGADSLDMMNILFGIQDRFSIEISDDSVGELTSIAAICDFVNKA